MPAFILKSFEKKSLMHLSEMMVAEGQVFMKEEFA